MNEIFKKRFGELEVAHTKFTYRDGGVGGTFAVTGTWEGWATSVENLIRAIFGEETPHYKNFREAYSKCRSSDHEINRLISLFRSAKDDFEGGYVFNVELRISGEVSVR